MIKTRKMSVLFLSGVLALLLVAFMAVSVSANAASSAKLSVSHAHVVPNAVPNSNIVGKGKKANYKPNTLKCNHLNMPALDITNKTKVPQTVTQNGTPIVTIPPGGVQGFNVSGPGTAIVSLKSNPKAMLTITCT